MKQLILPALLLSLLTTAAAQAGTASTASTGFGNFSYSLIDLDPSDGIAASLTFGSTGFGANVNGNLTLSGSSPTPHVDTFSDAPSGALRDLSASSSLFPAAGSGSATVTKGAGGIVGSSGAATAVIQDNSPSRITTYDISSMLMSTAFTLSPHTLLIFSADAYVSANNDPTLSALGRAQIISTSRLNVSGPIGNSFQQSSAQIRAEADTRWASQSSNESLSVTFANISGSAVTGHADLESSVRGSVLNVSAVPEPETYGMLLAGLGVMGLIARRRKRA